MPRADMVGKIAKALGTSVEYLVTGQESEARFRGGVVSDVKHHVWADYHPTLMKVLLELESVGELEAVERFASFTLQEAKAKIQQRGSGS